MLETARPFDPFAPLPDAGLIRRHADAIRRAAVAAIEDAPGRELPPFILAAVLSRSLGIGRDSFPHALRQLERDAVVTLDRTPGRVRVRLPEDARTAGDEWRRAAGDLAAYGLDLVEAGGDAVAEQRARRKIADAVERIPYGEAEVERLIRYALHPEVADAVLSVVRKPVAVRLVESLDEVKVLRAVQAAGREGLTWSALRRSMKGRLAADLDAVVDRMAVDGLVAVVERAPPGSGRVGRFVVAC